MTTERPRRGRACQIAVAGIAAVGIPLAGAAAGAHAEEAGGEIDRFDGSFSAWQVQGGAAAVGGAGFTTPVLGASFRYATLLSLLDVQAGLRGREGGAGLLVELHPHPFFLTQLTSGRFGLVLAGLHGVLGAEALWRDGPGAAGHLGAGWDLPLSDPDHAGPWVGLGWRRVFHSSGFSDEIALTLALRFPGPGSLRVPPPTELRWRRPRGGAGLPRGPADATPASLPGAETRRLP